MELNDRIKYIRETVLRYTQGELADLLGLKSRQTIYEYEIGKIKPSIENLQIIADKCVQQGYDFKDTITWLTTGEGDIKPRTFTREKAPIVQEPQQYYNNTGGTISIFVTLQELNIIEKMRQLPEATPMIDSILTSWLTINNTINTISSNIKSNIQDKLQE